MPVATRLPPQARWAPDPWFLDDVPGIGRAHRAVLRAIVRLSRDGECAALREEIARLSRYSVGAVSAAIAWLREHELIELRPNRAAGSGRTIRLLWQLTPLGIVRLAPTPREAQGELFPDPPECARISAPARNDCALAPCDCALAPCDCAPPTVDGSRASDPEEMGKSEIVPSRARERTREAPPAPDPKTGRDDSAPPPRPGPGPRPEPQVAQATQTDAAVADLQARLAALEAAGEPKGRVAAQNWRLERIGLKNELAALLGGTRNAECGTRNAGAGHPGPPTVRAPDPVPPSVYAPASPPPARAAPRAPFRVPRCESVPLTEVLEAARALATPAASPDALADRLVRRWRDPGGERSRRHIAAAAARLSPGVLIDLITDADAPKIANPARYFARLTARALASSP